MMTSNQFIFAIAVAFSGAATVVLVFGSILFAMKKGTEELERSSNPAWWVIFGFIVAIGLYNQLPH